MSAPLTIPARALAWWRPQASLQFGLACLAAKIATDMLALTWSGWAGFVHVASPGMDLLAFFPACVLLYEFVRRLPGVARVITLAAVLIAIAAAIICDLLCLEFFRAHLPSVLPVLIKTHAIDATGANRIELVQGDVLAVVAAFMVGSLLFFWRKRTAMAGFLAPSLLVLAGYIVETNREALLQASLNVVTHDGFDYKVGASIHLPEKTLGAAHHLAPVVKGEVRYAPQTLVLLINESLPSQFESSDDPHRLLFDKLLDESGLDRANWRLFSRAFTNSSATDISMPSIMTGADSAAGTDEVEALPFIYSVAKVRGYSTAFFTSQDYGWANLRNFFKSEDLDEFLSSEMTGQPSANLLGIDDVYVARRIADFVRAKGPSGRLFLVLNNNALHVPYQIESMIHVPGYAKEAKTRAAFITEQFYDIIFKSLRDTGRLADSFIIVTSDHGEMHPLRKRDLVRMDSHYDEVAKVPFAIYMPPSAPAALRQRLDANVNRTVANNDIAPTLAGMLGMALSAGHVYPGYDLFGAIPIGRVNVSVSNNEWRPWHLNAFGLQSGDDRLVFHQKLGMTYFDVSKDPDERNPITSGPKFDSYRAFVMVHPTLPMWLSGDKPE